jgi:site-specific DNA recombinase
MKFGYMTEGKGPKILLVIEEEQATIIRWIYQSYLRGAPDYIIHSDARDMGLKVRNNNLIKDIITNPIYSSQQYVKPLKGSARRSVSFKRSGPIGLISWNQVQQRINRKIKKNFSIADEMPSEVFFDVTAESI